MRLIFAFVVLSVRNTAGLGLGLGAGSGAGGEFLSGLFTGKILLLKLLRTFSLALTDNLTFLTFFFR